MWSWCRPCADLETLTNNNINDDEVSDSNVCEVDQGSSEVTMHVSNKRTLPISPMSFLPMQLPVSLWINNNNDANLELQECFEGTNSSTCEVEQVSG